MIASLPMYERPETRDAHDRLWAHVRKSLPNAPESLARPDDPWDVWRAPDLLLAQTCGLPFRAALQYHTSLVGTPDYGLQDCPPGYYHSVFVCHVDELSPASPQVLMQQSIAVNDPLSQSGWAVVAETASEARIELLNEARFLEMPDEEKVDFALKRRRKIGKVIITGSHLESARAVVQRRASVAALDAVTWTLIQRYEDFAQHLTVVGRTPPTPGLPLITALPQQVDDLRAAFGEAIDALSGDDQDALMLRGLADISKEAYLRLPIPAPPPA